MFLGDNLTADCADCAEGRLRRGIGGLNHEGHEET